MTIRLSSTDRQVLPSLRPAEDCFRVYDGLPDPAVVQRIARDTGLHEFDVHYCLKYLRIAGLVPTPPKEPVEDLLTFQVLAAVTRLRTYAPFPLFDEHGSPLPGAVHRVQEHCAYPYADVQRRLAELRIYEESVQ